MADPNETPPFLTMPLELREQIYKGVLSYRSNGPELLRTCREIYTEAHKYVFQRPLVFCGQSALYDWLEKVKPTHLHHISEITIELHDADLKSLIAPAPTDETPPGLQAWELYEQDLEKLQHSCHKLANIKTLTMRSLSERRSFFYRDVLSKFLGQLHSIWPHLSSLCLEGNFHQQPLSFLASLPELRSFSFDGFSSSSHSETATLLSGLQHLESLSLDSQHGLLTPSTNLHSAFTSKRQSFNTDVLRAVKHLSSFSVMERVQPPESSTALFFTPEMLATLHSHAALKKLTVALGHAPDTETLEALDAFLECSAIERLELDWPGLGSSVFEDYELLPSGLKYLWVRVESLAVAFGVLCVVLEGRDRGELGSLRRVVLMRRNGERNRGDGEKRTEGAGGATGDDENSEEEEEEEEEEEKEKEKVEVKSDPVQATSRLESGDANADDTAATSVKDGSEINPRRKTRSGADSDDDSDLSESDESALASAIGLLNVLGVQVLWCTIDDNE